jgi:hypothetical protein
MSGSFEVSVDDDILTPLPSFIDRMKGYDAIAKEPTRENQLRWFDLMLQVNQVNFSPSTLS